MSQTVARRVGTASGAAEAQTMMLLKGHCGRRRRDVIEMMGTPRPTPRDLWAEIGDVIHDLPAFLTAPLYRRRHLRGGPRRPSPTPCPAIRSCRAPSSRRQGRSPSSPAGRRVAVAGPGRLPAGRLVQQRPARQSRPPQRHHDRARLPASRGRPMGADVPLGAVRAQRF